jgi:hypothetical protein
MNNPSNNRKSTDTYIDPQPSTSKKDSKATISDEPLTEPNTGKQFSQRQALLVGGAIVAGVAALGGVAYAQGAFNDAPKKVVTPPPAAPPTGGVEEPPKVEPPDEEGDDAKVFNPHTAPIATGVNDEMSFGEAFAAARAETGPGGVFTWHGQNYHTFVAGEIDQNGHPVIDYPIVPPHELPAVEPWEPGEEEGKTEGPEVTTGGTSGGQGEPGSEGEGQEEGGGHPVPPIDNPGGGDSTEGGGSEPTVIGIDEDQNGVVDVAFVDINHDGEADAMLADVNQDGQLTEDEVQIINDPESLTEAAVPANPGQMTVDLDGNNEPDIQLIDTDQDLIANTVSVDVNGDGILTEDEIAVLQPMDDTPEITATGEFEGEIMDTVPEDVIPTDPSADMAALDDNYDTGAWA